MRTPLERIIMFCLCTAIFCGVAGCDYGTAKPEDAEGSFTVAVDFNDGEEIWTAAVAEWLDYRDKYGEIHLFFRGGGEHPAIMGSVLPATTVFSEPLNENSLLYIEYYSPRWPEVSGELSAHVRRTYFGDWQVESGSVTVTSLTETRMSGTANLVMYDYYEREVRKNPAAAKKTLTVTFSDVPVYRNAQSIMAGKTPVGI